MIFRCHILQKTSDKNVFSRKSVIRFCSKTNSLSTSEPNHRPSASNLLLHPYLSLPAGWSFPGIPEMGERVKHQGGPAPSNAEVIDISTANLNQYPPSQSSPSAIKLGALCPNSLERDALHKASRPRTPPLVYINPPGPRQHTSQSSLGWDMREKKSSLTHVDSGNQEFSQKIPSAARRLMVYNPDSSDNISSQRSFNPLTYKPPPLPEINGSTPYSAHLAPLPRTGSSHATPRAPSVQQTSYNKESSGDTDTDYGSTWKRPPADLVPLRRQIKIDGPSSQEISGNMPSSSHSKLTPLPTICNTRPPAHQVIERLEEFFPAHNLDDPVVESHDQPDLLSEMNSSQLASRRCTMKSIKRIVGEQINRPSPADPRRTWLWNSHVEEIKVTR